jgi:hypothetical protein
MAQELEPTEPLKDLKTLLHAMGEMEEKNLKGLADLPSMSIDHLELLLVSYCPHPSRKYAILLKRLFEEYKESNADKSINDQIEHSKRFTWFSKLPPELRRCIWCQALPGPQIIELYHHKSLSGVDRIEVATSSQVPLVRLLKVCHEAKEVVKSNFRTVDARAFGVQNLPIGATILINYFQDVINLDRRTILNCFLREGHATTRLGAEELANIQYLAVDSKEFSDFISNSSAYWIGLLARLKSLKKLSVVLGETRESKTRRDHCHRNSQIRLYSPRSDYQHIITRIHEKWSIVLKKSHKFEHLASLKISFRTMHLLRDRGTQPLMICPTIQNEIDRLLLLDQVKKP